MGFSDIPSVWGVPVKHLWSAQPELQSSIGAILGTFPIELSARSHNSPVSVTQYCSAQTQFMSHFMEPPWRLPRQLYSSPVSFPTNIIPLCRFRLQAKLLLFCNIEHRSISHFQDNTPKMGSQDIGKFCLLSFLPTVWHSFWFSAYKIIPIEVVQFYSHLLWEGQSRKGYSASAGIKSQIK